MNISFVIPVYNEEESLKQLYQEIISAIGTRSYEIIFVDDGSRDNSFSILSELAAGDANVRVIRFRRNFGKASALQYAFSIAQGEYICTMDADLQDDPAELPKFFAAMNNGFEVVSGWKQHRKDPLYKTLPSLIFNAVTTSTFGLKLRDYNCGFKLYQRAVVKEIMLYGEMHRFIPALADALGYKVGEIPVNHRPRIYGQSKYGLERYLRGFFDLLTVKVVTQYIRSPLYLFGRVGIVSAILGLIITVYLSLMKLLYHHPLTNRPLLFLGILLIIAGIQFFSMGLICEIIVNRSQRFNNDNISIKQTINYLEQKNRDRQA